MSQENINAPESGVEKGKGRPLIGNGPGASDDSSGGGNASGAPDADTAMRAEGAISKGNVEEDRKKLFPEKR